jgi:putative sugar O-methyltransferase
LLEWVKTRPSCRILEIGAGYGALAWYLLKVLHNVEYVIVDIPESLAYSAIYLSALVPGRVKFIPNYRFLEMAFAERFDLVINTNSLSELSEAQVRAYSEAISRMLSPGGFFFEQNQDQTGHGWLNAQMILRNYFPACRRLGKPPELPHGFANVWSMDYAGER